MLPVGMTQQVEISPAEGEILRINCRKRTTVVNPSLSCWPQGNDTNPAVSNPFVMTDLIQSYQSTYSTDSAKLRYRSLQVKSKNVNWAD